MQTLHLSKRLSAIADLVPLRGGVADVGTDHGYIPVWLLQNGFSGAVFATDINAEPLARAQKAAADFGLSDKISFRLCDGLALVDSSDISTVIIAGMGGENIAAILQNAPWTRDCTLILQPMSRVEVLRNWLFENGYRVLTERLIEDGVIYEILTATGGDDEAYCAGEALTGRFSLISGDPLFSARLDALIEKTERAVAGLERAQTPDAALRLVALRETLDGLLDMRARL